MFLIHFLSKEKSSILNHFLFSPKHSSVQIHDTKQGYYFLLLHNVCYDFNRDGLNIYVKNSNDVDLSVIPKGSLSTVLLFIVFPDGWGFQTIEGEFPTNGAHIENPNNYILIPHSARNIAHYMEVFTFVYHVLHQPHKFPRV